MGIHLASPARGRVSLGAALLLVLAVLPSRGVAPVADLSKLEIALPSRERMERPIGESTMAPLAEDLVRTTESAWQGSVDERAGRVDRIFPARLDLVAPGADAPEVDAALRAFLAAHEGLFGAPVGDLATVRLQLRAGVWWVTYQQTLDGLAVLGARLDARLDEEGRLLFVQDRTIAGLVAPASGIGRAEAEARAAASLEAAGLTIARLAPALPGIAEMGPTAEVIVAIFDAAGGAEAHRAWRVRHDILEPPARFRSYVDARTGGVLGRENEILYALAEGSVQGDIQPSTPTDPFQREPFEDLRVAIEGVGEVFTGETGGWSADLPDEDPRVAIARLDGRFVNVNRQDAADAVASGVAAPGTPLDLVFTEANSHPAERDVFYHVNLVHDYVQGIDPEFTDIDYEMPAAVNLAQTCNAYWDGFGINFFAAGGGCANTGQIADVIYHEYGHGVTQYAYAPGSPSGAMHEGFSDYLGATITNQSKIGLGFSGPGTWLRDCDNNRTWPAPECGGEPHCVGEVIAGALWHMRENLIGELGDHDAAVALSDHLFHFAKFGGNNDFEGYYFDLLALDDDNGTLVDGTPHALSIIQAFDRHNIGPGFILEILHTPLHDTDRADTPIPVVATFSSPDELDEGSLEVVYTTQATFGGPLNGPFSLPMSPTGGIREYQASIPGQPLNTRVRYYIQGETASLGLIDTDPDGAPTNQHTFMVAVDTTPPLIAHEPKTERSRHVWPVPIEATVTDNQAVGSVALEYRVNGVDRPSVALSAHPDGRYAGIFGGSVAVSDLVEYRLVALDAALNPNVTRLPAEGYFALPIVRDIVTAFEEGLQDWSHAIGTPNFVDQWHLSTHRDHTAGGDTSWKFGSTGAGNYADGADGALEFLPVSLGPGASLSFWHWIAAENEGATQAWDGALVEISVDDGLSWAPLMPAGGYTHQIIDNPASPFPPGYPVWSGFFDWRRAEFDLSAYAGQRIRLRWRFGSDGYVTYEGWYVDDLTLVTTIDESTGIGQTAELLPARTALLGAQPNPFNPRTTIRFDVAPRAGTVRLSIHDVAGRLVRVLAEEDLQPGRHAREWDGRDQDGRSVATGVYFARIRARGADEARKLQLLK